MRSLFHNPFHWHKPTNCWTIALCYYCEFHVMLSWWQLRHNDVFPRPLPPASNCFVLGTIRWPSYKWWCDITHHTASHITSVSRDTLVTSVLCNIRTCWSKNFIKPPSLASPDLLIQIVQFSLSVRTIFIWPFPPPAPTDSGLVGAGAGRRSVLENN